MKKTLLIVLTCMACLLLFTGCGKNKDVIAAEEAIEAIGKVTLKSGEAIEAAEKLYDILTDDEKSDVSNRLDLTEARKTFDELLNEQILEEYHNNFDSATYTMLLGAADAEEAGNLIVSVWYNSIYKKKDETTDLYTRPNGTFYDDFNDALSELFSDIDFQNKVSNIKANQDEVTALMKNLRTPPADYEDAYSAIKDYYNKYIKFTNMVINPTGSYTSFSDDFINTDNELMDAYNAIKIYTNY